MLLFGYDMILLILVWDWEGALVLAFQSVGTCSDVLFCEKQEIVISPSKYTSIEKQTH